MKQKQTHTDTHTPIQDYTTDNVLTNKQMCDSSKSITPGQLHMKHASQTHLVGEGLRKPHTTRRKCVQTSVTPIWVWTGSAAVPCALNLWGGRETRHHFATSIWKVQHNYMVFYKEQTFLQSKRKQSHSGVFQAEAEMLLKSFSCEKYGVMEIWTTILKPTAECWK